MWISPGWWGPSCCSKQGRKMHVECRPLRPFTQTGVYVCHVPVYLLYTACRCPFKTISKDIKYSFTDVKDNNYTQRSISNLIYVYGRANSTHKYIILSLILARLPLVDAYLVWKSLVCLFSACQVPGESLASGQQLPHPSLSYNALLCQPEHWEWAKFQSRGVFRCIRSALPLHYTL